MMIPKLIVDGCITQKFNLPLNIVIKILIFFFLIGCHQSGLRKISEEDLILRTVENRVPQPDEVRILDTLGNIISSDSLKTLIFSGEYFQDFYINSEDEIVQVRVREKTSKDDSLIKKIQQAFDRQFVLDTIEINCQDKISILQDVFDRDQNMRTGQADIDPEIDHQNLEIIISLIDQCGIPTLSEVNDVQMAAIWAVLQHAPSDYQRKYIPNLEQSALKGDIPWRVIALMKDRALMHEGKPQIYGSQTVNGALYELHEPEFVNQRREEIGLGTIEEYLNRFDIEFNVVQKTTSDN